jgi:hypothetical protein
MKKQLLSRFVAVFLLLVFVLALALLIYCLIPNRWGLIDKKGVLVVRPQFEDISKGFLEEPSWPALVKKNGKWQYC